MRVPSLTIAVCLAFTLLVSAAPAPPRELSKWLLFKVPGCLHSTLLYSTLLYICLVLSYRPSMGRWQWIVITQQSILAMDILPLTLTLYQRGGALTFTQMIGFFFSNKSIRHKECGKEGGTPFFVLIRVVWEIQVQTCLSVTPPPPLTRRHIVQCGANIIFFFFYYLYPKSAKGTYLRERMSSSAGRVSTELDSNDRLC